MSVLLRRWICREAILRTGHQIAIGVLPGVVMNGAYGAEHVAVLELGGAGEWGLTDSPSHFGPTLAVEVTPIEHWLELEFGVSALRSHGATEWETDLLFKKPYQLSRTVEFMAGLGPVWSHSSSSGERANSVGAEFVLDFVFWPKERWGCIWSPATVMDLTMNIRARWGSPLGSSSVFHEDVEVGSGAAYAAQTAKGRRTVSVLP